MALHWDEMPLKADGSYDLERQAQNLMSDAWDDLQKTSEVKPRKSFSNVSAAITQEVQRRSPSEQSYSDSLVHDALLRLANLDAMKVPGAEFRDTITALAEQLKTLVPKRQQGCLPHTAAGFAHAIRRSQIFLLGTLTIKWTRSNGRSLIVLRRVDQ